MKVKISTVILFDVTEEEETVEGIREMGNIIEVKSYGSYLSKSIPAR